MKLTFDYYHNLEKVELRLCNPDGRELFPLPGKNRNLTLRFNDLSELTFEVESKITLSDNTVVDLEAYDYSKESTSPIRATEGTVLSRIPPRVEIRRDAALELPHGRAVALRALSCDEAHDGLRLAQVDAAVEEGTPGEFAGGSQFCAVTQAKFQHPLGDVSAAVELDLRHVLPRVGAGCAHKDGHRFVHHGIAIINVPVGQHVRGQRHSLA